MSKSVVCAVAKRLRADGLRSVSRPSTLNSQPTAWLERSTFGLRISEFVIAQPGMSANAFGSDWAQLLTFSQPSTLNHQPACAPLNQERRFIPLRLDDAPIKGALAQFLCINWLPAHREQEYAKLSINTCLH